MRMPQMNPKLARRKQRSGRKKKGTFMRIPLTGARRKKRRRGKRKKKK